MNARKKQKQEKKAKARQEKAKRARAQHVESRKAAKVLDKNSPAHRRRALEGSGVRPTTKPSGRPSAQGHRTQGT